MKFFFTPPPDSLTKDPINMPDEPPPNAIRYTCQCGNEIWGEPGIKVRCGDCNTVYVGED